MDPDRLEGLVTQVLEETRAFRQETKEKFAEVNDKFAEVNEKLAIAAQERQGSGAISGSFRPPSSRSPKT